MMIFTKTTNLRNVFLLLAIAGTLVVAPALILSPQSAQAQQDRVVDGRGTGQVNCPAPDGGVGESPPGEELIFLAAVKNKGSIQGFMTIQSEDRFQAKSGTVTSGNIGAKQFTLRGLENADDICSTPIPSTFTITGQCGISVPIQFRSSTGQEGEFIGNVACAR
jgi:hypothetical protein